MSARGAGFLHGRRTTARVGRSVLVLARRTFGKTVPAVLVVLCAAFGGLLPALPAQAATGSDAVSWSVTPADPNGADGRSWIELVAEPGAQIQEHLAIHNLGAVDATFLLTARDGYFTENGRFDMLQTGETSTGAGTWIDLAAEVEVAAGAIEIVPFTVVVPADAAPGDHAAGVAASVLSTGEGTDGAGIRVESRVGFRLMTRVTGELEPGLEVDRIEVDYETAWNPFAPGDATVDVVVRNSGNTRLSLGAAFTVAGVAGSIPDRPVELLPGDVRTVRSEVTGVWPTVLSPAVADLTAEVIMPDGGTADRLARVRAESAAWSMPWPQLLLVLGTALLSAALLSDRRRRAYRMDRLLAEARSEGARAAREYPHAGRPQA